MKKNIFASLALAALLAGCATAERQAERIGYHGAQMQDMSTAAQSTVKQQVGDAQILDIDKETRSGQTVYEVTFQPAGGGAKEKLHVAEDGTLLGERQAGARGLWNEMKEAAGAERKSKSEFKTESSDTGARGEYKSNQSSDTKSAEFNAGTSSGAGVSAKADLNRNDSAGASAEFTTGKDTSGQAEAEFKTDSAGAQTSAKGPRVGTKWEDLPAAVKTAIKEQNASAEVADIDKKTQNGKTFYKVSFKEPGRNPKIFVSEDGTLMDQSEFNESAGAEVNAKYSGGQAADTIHARKEVRGGAEDLLKTPNSHLFDKKAEASAEVSESAGAEKRSEFKAENEPAGAQVKGKTQTTESRSEEAAETEVKMTDLPDAVQTTIRDRAGDQKDMRIEKETKNGKTVYEVKFQDKSKNFCVSEDGKIYNEKEEKE